MRHLIVVLFVALIPLCATGLASAFSSISPALLLSQVGSAVPVTVSEPVAGAVYSVGDTINIKWSENPVTQYMVMLAKKTPSQATGLWTLAYVKPNHVSFFVDNRQGDNVVFYNDSGQISWTIPSGEIDVFESRGGDFVEARRSIAPGDDYFIQVFEFHQNIEQPGINTGGRLIGESKTFTIREISRQPWANSGPRECLYFGVAVTSRRLSGNRNDLASGTYSDLVKNNYNILVAENSMKFGPIHPGQTSYNFSESDKIANFARQNNMIMRGHTFVWRDQNPDWVYNVNKENEMRLHMRTLFGRYGDVTKYWDVVNEWISNSGAGPWSFSGDTVKKAFIMAREEADKVDPTIKLVYNDYGLWNDSGKRQRVLNLVNGVTDASGNKLVQVVGLQMHCNIGGGNPSYNAVSNALRDFTNAGYEVQLTEVDCPGARADHYENMLKACVDNNRCTSFTTWGVSDDESWLNNFIGGGRNLAALPFDSNLQPKPAWTAMQKVLRDNNVELCGVGDGNDEATNPPPSVEPPVNPPSTVGDGTVSVDNWQGGKKAALSITFDDADRFQSSQHDLARDLISRGLRGTYFLSVGDISNQNAYRSYLAQHNHEIGSHGLFSGNLDLTNSSTHQGKNLNQIIGDARQQISQRFDIPNSNAMTFAIPQSRVNPQVNSVVSANHFASRSGTEGTVSANPSSLHNLISYAWSSSDSRFNDAGDMNRALDTAISRGDWMIDMIHGTGGEGYNPPPRNEYQAHFNYAKQKEGEVWIAPFGEVARYVKERQSITNLSSRNVPLANGGYFEITANFNTANLPPRLWSGALVPLTYAVKLPAGFNQQINAPARLEQRSGGAYAVIDALPEPDQAVQNYRIYYGLPQTTVQLEDLAQNWTKGPNPNDNRAGYRGSGYVYYGNLNNPPTQINSQGTASFKATVNVPTAGMYKVMVRSQHRAHYVGDSLARDKENDAWIRVKRVGEVETPWLKFFAPAHIVGAWTYDTRLNINEPENSGPISTVDYDCEEFDTQPNAINQPLRLRLGAGANEIHFAARSNNLFMDELVVVKDTNESSTCLNKTTLVPPPPPPPSAAVAATPVISAISPSSGPFGTRAVIVGRNFAAMNTVKINGTSVGQYSGTNNGTNIVISGMPFVGTGAPPANFTGDLRVQVVANNLNSNERVFRITPQASRVPTATSLPASSFLNNADWKATKSVSGSSVNQKLTNWEWASVYQTVNVEANSRYTVQAKIHYRISDASKYDPAYTGLFVVPTGSVPGSNNLCRDLYTTSDANNEVTFQCTFSTGDRASVNIVIAQWLRDQRCRNTYDGTDGRSCYDANFSVREVTIEKVVSMSWLRSGSLMAANVFQAMTDLFTER